MRLREIAVATIALARSEDDARILRDGLDALSSLGVPVTVADGGSAATFVQSIADLPHTTVLDAGRKGLIGQVRASLTHARRTGAHAILYTEPDKRDFFLTHLPAFVDAADLDAGTGIVVASRSADALATFPPVQQYTEAVANRLCADATGLDADFMYGPFLLRPAVVPYLEDLPLTVGWGWRPFLFALAPRLGLSVRSIAGEFRCPAEQRLPDDAERLHRLRQLSQNVDGIVRAARKGSGSVLRNS